MSKELHLTPLEVKDLIRKYKSELRKLEFQIHKIQSTIQELNASLPEEDPVIATIQMTTSEGEVAPKAAKPEKKAKAKTTAKKTAAKAPNKTRKEAKPKTTKPKSNAKGKTVRNTRLNEWDEFVIATIEKAGKALINSEIQEEATKSGEIKLSGDKLSIKLNQTLHKLANKKQLLKKVKYSGRGYAYALASWMTSKGDLPKKYQR